MPLEVARARVVDRHEALTPAARLDVLAVRLSAAGDHQRAEAMAAYMKGIAPFFGVPATPRRAIQRVVFAKWKPDAREVIELAVAAWGRDERELQYAACDVLTQRASRLVPSSLGDLESLITCRSWWDTVDALAHAVGELVDRHRDLQSEMDRWIEAEDFWLARVALIHQLRYGEHTDEERLFAYCDRRASDREFFVRKAIGWALRQHARTRPDAVRAFVDARADQLSGLSIREALKHLT